MPAQFRRYYFAGTAYQRCGHEHMTLRAAAECAHERNLKQTGLRMVIWESFVRVAGGLEVGKRKVANTRLRDARDREVEKRKKDRAARKEAVLAAGRLTEAANKQNK